MEDRVIGDVDLKNYKMDFMNKYENKIGVLKD
jgi:hypothetical protein